MELPLLGRPRRARMSRHPARDLIMAQAMAMVLAPSSRAMDMVRAMAMRRARLLRATDPDLDRLPPWSIRLRDAGARPNRVATSGAGHPSSVRLLLEPVLQAGLMPIISF